MFNKLKAQKAKRFICRVRLSVLILILSTSFVGHTKQNIRCTIKVFNDLNKELLAPNQTEEFKLLGEKRISAEVASVLYKMINKKSSFTKGRANLTHANIYVHFESEKINSKIQFSSYTRNVYGSSLFKSPDIRGLISEKFELYLIQLLTKYKLIDLIDESLKFPNQIE